jgi:hypothetical protein
MINEKEDTILIAAKNGQIEVVREYLLKEFCNNGMY